MRNLVPLCALALVAPSLARADQGKGDESIDSIVQQAEAPPPAPPPKVEKKAPPPVDEPPAPPPGPKVASARKAPKLEAAPITDDNDNAAEAARPAALTAVAPAGKPRVIGPYELGALDCRMLDGAGIERILPKKIMAGEEPDLLCRVIVTQPATVAIANHSLTLTVSVGTKATYQQVRSIRMSSIGRRSMVFIVPADRISSEEAAHVTMRVQLSAPAKPPVREIKFDVEPAD